MRRQLTWALSEKILATDPQALAVEKNGSAYSAFLLPASSARAGGSAAKIFPKIAPVSLYSQAMTTQHSFFLNTLHICIHNLQHPE